MRTYWGWNMSGWVLVEKMVSFEEEREMVNENGDAIYVNRRSAVRLSTGPREGEGRGKTDSGTSKRFVVGSVILRWTRFSKRMCG